MYLHINICTSALIHLEHKNRKWQTVYVQLIDPVSWYMTTDDDDGRRTTTDYDGRRRTTDGDGRTTDDDNDFSETSYDFLTFL